MNKEGETCDDSLNYLHAPDSGKNGEELQYDETNLFLSDSSDDNDNNDGDGDDIDIDIDNDNDEIQKALDDMIQQGFEEMQNELQQKIDDQISQEIQKQIEESTKSYELELERSIEEQLSKDLETSLSIQVAQQHSQSQPLSSVTQATAPYVNQVNLQIDEIVKRYQAGEIKEEIKK